MGTPVGTSRSDGQTKELRLALVCYGGSSLAIYMHGVTKELHRMVKGSALLETAEGAGDSATPSERVYAKLLNELAGQHPEGVRTRVVVDVIAGTSAGGINGICLAKGLAHNRSLDGFRDLWFRRGDIDGLLAAPKFLPRALKAAWVAVRAVNHAPLRGDLMAQWIYDAFDRMDQVEPNPELPTLMPDRHLLELFVTVTDFYGYGRQVPYADPNPIQDTRHRHLLAFRYGGDDRRDDFDGSSNGALTFAARTTSCIPGVFPPVSFDKLAGWLGQQRTIDLGDLEKRFFRIYDLAEFPPGWTWFVDGGVLDNKPFGPAVQAIRERPAELEVDRRLVYLEPDPGEIHTAAKQSAPGTIAAAIGGLTGLPRSEPILDDLVEISALNERVRRISDIVQTSWETVEAHVREIVGPMTSIPDAVSQELAQIKKRLDEDARKNAGFSYTTYVRLKISGVIDRYAQTVCAVCDLPPDSTHALLARSSIRRWAERKGLFEQLPEPSQAQLDFLVAFDLGYGTRRLRFVRDGLNRLYGSAGKEGSPPREQIDETKARLWEAIGTLRDAMAGTEFDDALTARFTAAFDVDAMREFMRTKGFDIVAYVDEHAGELDALEAGLKQFLTAKLSGFTAGLYGELLKLTEGWSDDLRWNLLVRYLGFPFWDVLLYPIQALSDVGERDHVEVVRISPRDTHRIPAPTSDPHGKLVGARAYHFGAFLSRAGREQDYLWGRLDGAERLIGLLIPPTDEAGRDRWCEEAFRAILEEDEQAVPNAADLVRHVRATIGPPPA